MGFASDLAKVGTFGLAGLALKNKKTPAPPSSIPMMINSPATRSPTSMIGTVRGGGY